MNKILVKILISIFAAIALLLVFFLMINRGSDSYGNIDFILYNENEEIVIEDQLSFNEGDTLFDVLNREYDLVCADSNYQRDETCSHQFINGYVLLEIEEVSSNWYDSVLSIYINGELANYGVSLIELEDGDLIEIKRTIYNE